MLVMTSGAYTSPNNPEGSSATFVNRDAVPIIGTRHAGVMKSSKRSTFKSILAARCEDSAGRAQTSAISIIHGANTRVNRNAIALHFL